MWEALQLKLRGHAMHNLPLATFAMQRSHWGRQTHRRPAGPASPLHAGSCSTACLPAWALHPPHEYRANSEGRKEGRGQLCTLLPPPAAPCRIADPATLRT